MDEKRLKGLMGLCVRAGQAVFGEDGCRRAVAEGRCGILLTDAEISQSARRHYEELCRREGIPTAVLPAGMLGEATGRPGKAMAVRDGNFAEQIRRCL